MLEPVISQVRVLPPCVCVILSVTPASVVRPATARSPEKLPVEVTLDRLNPLLPSMFPLTTKSPPKTDFDVPPTDPLTNRTASDVIVGKDDAVFAITSVPVTAVLEVPLLPDIVPTRAIFYSLKINITPTEKMRVILFLS
jgi:hypothetical protein